MSFWGKIKKFFSKLWDQIRAVIATILVVIAVILAIIACIVTLGAATPIILVLGGVSITMTASLAVVLAVVAMTCAYLVDAETTDKVVNKVAEAVGKTAEAAAEIVGAATDGIIDGLLGSKYVGYALAAAGAFFAYKVISSSDSSSPSSNDDLNDEFVVDTYADADVSSYPNKVK